MLIFGAGPVGIMAAKSAWLRGAERVIIVDTVQYRLDKAIETANAEGILWEEGDGKKLQCHQDGFDKRLSTKSDDDIANSHQRT